MKKETMLLLTICILSPLMGIGIDIYTPSLPVITEYYHTASYMVKLSIGLYMIGCLIGNVISGSVADFIGNKKVAVYSILLFMISSGFIIVSPNVLDLIILRVFQGIGAGGTAVVCISLLIDSFQGKELAKASVYSSLAFSLGPTLAPSIGGYIEQYFYWQGSFTFMFIYSLIALIIVLKSIDNTKPKLNEKISFRKTIDIYKKIIVKKVFIYITLSLVITYSIRVIFNVVGPFLIQDQLHFSSAAYGNFAMFLGVASLIGCIFNRFLLKYFSNETIIFIGVSLGIISTFSMFGFAVFHIFNVYVIIIPLVVLFIGENLFWPYFITKNTSVIPEYSGAASGLSGMILTLGVGILSSLSSFMNSSSFLPISVLYLILSSAVVVCFFIVYGFKWLTPTSKI